MSPVSKTAEWIWCKQDYISCTSNLCLWGQSYPRHHQHSLQKELLMKRRAVFYSFPMATSTWGFRVKSWAHSN